MPRLVFIPLLALVLWAGLCPAAEDEAPETATIEVEVVYKDTGELVEDVIVIVECGDRETCMETAPSGRLSVPVETRGTSATYSVRVRHAVPFMPRRDAQSSTFVDYEPAPLRSVEFLPGVDVVTARLEVERGLRLCGRVSRKDGSPLAGGTVTVEQSDAGCHQAFSLTDAEGRFDMLGIAPAEHARIIIYAAPPSEHSAMGAPLGQRLIALAGRDAWVDLAVEAVPVKLSLEILKPLWPFSGDRMDYVCIGQAWVGTVSEDSSRWANLAFYPRDWASTRWTQHRERFELALGDFPPGLPVTVSVGFARVDAAPTFPPTLSSRSWTTVKLGAESEVLSISV